VDARRTPKHILRAHPPDQRAQFRLDWRSPSPSTRFPAPIAPKAGPMPTYQRLGSNNHDDRKDRRKPAIELNEEPTVVVRETSPALQLTPQDHQLMSERDILSLKGDLRLERRSQHGQNKPDQRDHRTQLSRFRRAINADTVFGTHRCIQPQFNAMGSAPRKQPCFGRRRTWRWRSPNR
jgi:hypothetical protein